MSQKTKDQLTDTAQNFFHLLEQLAKLKKTHFMKILILKNQIQDLAQIVDNSNYFFTNTYLIQMKKVSHGNLNKSTLETTINEIFSAEVTENEHIIKHFKEEYELQLFFFLL